MWLTALIFPLGVGVAAPGPSLSELGGNRVDYAIEARLEDPDHHLVGKLDAKWRNQTNVPTREIWFHLYLNAFSSTRSTHMRERRGSVRAADFEEGWGWQRVTGVQVGGVDVMPTFRYRQPDDDNADDRTVASVDLPREIAPGEEVEIQLAWDSNLPRVRRRTGFKGDFILAAQWFPKLGVFDGAKGWNCHQFHANTEFFSDYGTYDVTLDLPARYAGKVFGSGLVEARELSGDRCVTKIFAPSHADRARVDSIGKKPVVHDFTWTADPRFVVSEETFHAAEWRSRFASEVDFASKAVGVEHDLGLHDVTATLLMHPEHASQAHRHFEATCASLFFYGLWFGGYPYEHVTVVDPAYAAAAGGMEYPTLFTAGSQMFTTPDMHTPESVTVHECGHQFWYGLVGNNEFESSWMDEGFNTFSTSESVFRAFGRRRATTNYSGLFADGVPFGAAPGGDDWSDALSARALPFFAWRPLRDSAFVAWWRDQPALAFASQSDDPRWSDRGRFLSDPDRDKIDTPAWLYADSASYGVNSYNRTAVVLRSIPAAIDAEFKRSDGHAAFVRGLRRYAETYRYRHPSPDDFFATFQQGAGVDISWYFTQLFESRATIDWRISVDQRRGTQPDGLVQPEPGAAFVKPQVLEHADESASANWTADVMVAKRGELVLPVVVRLQYEDGTSEDVIWTRAAQSARSYLKLARSGKSKLVRAAVDPDGGYFIDLDRSNNQWFDATDEVAPTRWFERSFARFAQLFYWQAGIGG